MAQTWQILPDPLTPDLNPYAEVPLQTADSGRTLQTAFSGRGITRPFRRANGDVVTASGAELIKAGVGLILGTICQSQRTHGELPWRTEFGSLLPILRLQNNGPVLVGLAQHYVVEALGRWLPAVRVRQCDVRTRDDYTLLIAITYDIVDPPSARVLVPGIQTAVQLG